MNNQAAQTMPELPEPFQKAVIANRINTMAVRQGYEVGGYEKSPDLYTADKMHQYARDYAAALSQTAGVAEGPLNLRGDETNQEVLAEFIRVCREVKPVGQWPGERVCRAIENLMSGPRDFISPDDRSPLRFGVGRGNEGGRLGLMGRELTQNQHGAAGDAKCIWPDCGHDTNQVGYSGGCAGAYCPARNSQSAAPAASGGEVWTREMIADVHKRGEELFQRINPPAAASVSERARDE